MSQFLYRFSREDDGQDLIEYSLLITFIAIACMALVASGRPAINSIWGTSNSRLANADTAANGG